jgi:hypothetical protein
MYKEWIEQGRRRTKTWMEQPLALQLKFKETDI